MSATADNDRLVPYVPRLLVDWLGSTPEATWREVTGSLAFVDISGFTKLTERLARRGKIGAEEMSDLLNSMFSELLQVAYRDGAGLVKWGGDAVLLLFQGEDHAARACRAAYRMRAKLRDVGRLRTPSGTVTLRMSVGIHSGQFHFFLVGDPNHHRELIVSGPAASTTAVMEAIADAGEIALSPDTAALIDPSCLGDTKQEAVLLRRCPEPPEKPARSVVVPDGVDLRTALPEDIRSHLLAAPGEAEHRSIAVAFVQFSGTDSMLAESGPAALAEALHDVMSNVQRAAAAHGITFFETDINRDGGKIMLTAGAPISRGREEDRMLRAARAIVEGAGALPLRIGVNRGPVFSGDFGPPFRRTYSVKGDAINLAARVMGKAAPGEVLTTRAAFDLSGTAFETQDLPPFMVKGKSQPVNAVRLGRVLASRAERREQLLPLVGRSPDSEVLEQGLADVRERRGGVIRVIGEAGIGKSRLLQELDGGDEVPILLVACDEDEANTALVPVRHLFRRALGAASDISTEELADLLTQRVESVAPELMPWLPLLGVLAGIDLPATPESEALDEAFRKQRFDEVSTGFLEALLTDPVMLAFEDIHFADAASLDLIRRLATTAAMRSPWLLVVTARDDKAGELSGAANEQVLRLRPLSADAALELLTQATEGSPLPPARLAAMVQRAEGNPLFLLGLLQTTPGADSELPGSLEGLITSEIDRLPPSRRRILRYAAVLGTSFDEGLLRALLDDPDLPHGAAAFRPLRAFLRWSPGGQVSFRHSLIRDAAYDGLPYRRRRELHERVGTLLFETSDNPSATPEPLALHFYFAGNWAEAWKYARLAGDRSRSQYALAEAARFLSWAADSGRRAAVPGGELAAVLESLGDVRYYLGLSVDAAAAYRQALQTVRTEPERQAGLLLKEGRLLQRLGRLSLSLRRLRIGIRLLSDDSGPTAMALHSRLATRYAIARIQQGKFTDALRWGATAVELADDSGDLLARAEAHNVCNALEVLTGKGTGALHAEIAIACYEQVGDLTGQGHCFNNLGVWALEAGDWDQATPHFRRAAELFATTGDDASQAIAVYNQGDLLVRQGHIEEAEPLLRGALRIARAVGEESLAAHAIRELGKAAARAGRFEESRELFAEAAKHLTLLGEFGEVADADAGAAESFLLEGRAEEARTLAEAVIAAGTADSELLPALQRILGFALLQLGELTAARAAFETGLQLVAQDSNLFEEGLLTTGLAQLALLENDPAAGDLAAAGSRIRDRLGLVDPPLPADLSRN